MDQIYTQMRDDTESLELPGAHGVSRIRKFYDGKTIFITGSTGYIGKCIVEKILRGCPELKKLFLLIRSKKGMSPNERVQKYFDHLIFDPLRRMYPDFKEKVVPIVGDFMIDDMGISPEDRSLVVRETDLIIHNAASVIFDEQISTALKINVLGTKKMIELAMECHKLQCFLYVSTAYSHCYRKHIEEKCYDPPADLKMVEDMLKADQENERGLMSDALKVALGDWPNVYTFTKATAEGVIQDYSRRVNFPLVIYRPSVVSSTYREPIAQWCGNMQGPQIALIGAGIGFIHVLWMYDYPIDYVPADMATNSLLASTWDVVTNKKPQKEPHVYNFGSSNVNPVNMYDVREYMVPGGVNYPSIKSLWYYFNILTSCYYNFYLLHIIFHVIPIFIFDFVNLLQGKKPKYLPVLYRAQKHMDKLFYFSNGNWRIHVEDNTQALWDKMNVADQEEFYCDLRTLDWSDYFMNYWIGLRIYLLNEPLDNIEAARKRFAKLKTLHYTVVSIVALGFLYLAFRMMCYVLGF